MNFGSISNKFNKILKANNLISEKNISISQKHRFGIQKITAGDEKRLEKYLEPNSPACCKEKGKETLCSMITL